MRSGAAAFLAVMVAAAAALTVAAAERKTALAFTLGVPDSEIAVVLKPGRTACQGPIDTSAPFTAVQARLGTLSRPGPAVDVVVNDFTTGRSLTGGHLAPGYGDHSVRRVQTGAVAEGRRIDVCVRNAGNHRVAIYGGAWAADQSSELRHGKETLKDDMSLVFLREKRVSLLSLVPTIFARAALWHPGWVGAWTFWALVALLLVAVPVSLVQALRGTERE